MNVNQVNNDQLIKKINEFLIDEKEKSLSEIITIIKESNFITPAFLLEDEYYNFIALGEEDNSFRIPVFSNKRRV